MEYIYCAIFKKLKDDGYEVTFPDIFGGVTCGNDFEDAKRMAIDLLKIMLSTAKRQCFEPHSKQYFEKNLKSDEQIIQIKVCL